MIILYLCIFDQKMDEQENIIIEITVNCDVEFDISRLKLLAKSVFRRFSVEKAQAGIAIVGDEEIASINKKFLDHDGPTDVISFDLTGQEDIRSFEIIVNADLAARQAIERKHSAQAELALYITHGMLHNLGFDDLNESDAKKMHEMEDTILTDTGYGSVYKNLE